MSKPRGRKSAAPFPSRSGYQLPATSQHLAGLVASKPRGTMRFETESKSRLTIPLVVLAVLVTLLQPRSSQAACVAPAGQEAWPVFYTNSSAVYCGNGTAWNTIALGNASSPAFFVNKNGVDQAVGGAFVKLTWPNKVFDTTNDFNSNQFKPSVAGNYIITLDVQCSNCGASGATAATIRKNGIQVAESYVSNQGGNPSAAVSTVVNMNGSTDYVEAYAYNFNGTTITGNIDLTHFTGALVGGASATATAAGTSGQI
jgi:hypothetical protein